MSNRLAATVLRRCSTVYFQSFVRLTEQRCKEYVSSAIDGCKSKARVDALDLLVHSREQLRTESASCGDCLVPPNSSPSSAEDVEPGTIAVVIAIGSRLLE